MTEITVAQGVADYLEWLTDVRHVSFTTRYTYESTLKAFVKFCDERSVEHPEKVDTELLLAFTHRLRRAEQRQPSPATRRREHTTVQGLWTYLLKRGVVSTDPFWMYPRDVLPRRDPKPLSDEVWLTIWRSNLTMDDRLWLGLGFYTGLRRLELATLSPQHIDPDEGVMRLKRKGAHFVALEYRELCRTFALQLPSIAVGIDEWVELLSQQARWRSDQPYLVASSTGKYFHDVNFFNGRLKLLCRAAGLPDGAATPHQLRHSCATNLMRCGVPIEIIADQLNHTSVAVTRGYLRTSGQLARWRDSR